MHTLNFKVTDLILGAKFSEYSYKPHRPQSGAGLRGVVTAGLSRGHDEAACTAAEAGGALGKDARVSHIVTFIWDT